MSIYIYTNKPMHAIMSIYIYIYIYIYKSTYACYNVYIYKYYNTSFQINFVTILGFRLTFSGSRCAGFAILDDNSRVKRRYNYLYFVFVYIYLVIDFISTRLQPFKAEITKYIRNDFRVYIQCSMSLLCDNSRVKRKTTKYIHDMCFGTRLYFSR